MTLDEALLVTSLLLPRRWQEAHYQLLCIDSATAAGPNALVLSFAVPFLVLAAFNQTVLFLPPSTP